MKRTAKLVEQFNQEAKELYQRMKDAAKASGRRDCMEAANSFNLSYCRGQLHGRNGMAICAGMAGDPKETTGFKALCNAGLFDVTVESLVLQEEYRCLFQDSVIAAAEAKKARAFESVKGE